MKIKNKKPVWPILIFFLVFAVIITFATFSKAFNPDENKDTDGDGLTDYQEKAIYQTFWYDKDTDQDGYDDGLEVANGYSPKQKNLTLLGADTDNDGLSDAWEIKLGTNLMIRDTDKDGFLDGTEVFFGFSPTNPQPVKVDKLIEINIADFKLNYYFDNILMDSLTVSTGKTSTPTPIGDFSILNRVASKTYGGSGYNFHYPNTKWNLHFTTKHGLRYYIHGAYWHDKFGQENVSGGCINVKYEDMERLYHWTNIGTKVEIK